jgi:hypothetical protein
MGSSRKIRSAEEFLAFQVQGELLAMWRVAEKNGGRLQKKIDTPRAAAYHRLYLCGARPEIPVSSPQIH